jgi:hypothetical protein
MAEYGRPEWTRTIDLFRVKNEVTNLKPFGCRAFPPSVPLKNTLFVTSFVDELLTSFSVEFASDFCNPNSLPRSISTRSPFPHISGRQSKNLGNC